jgi:hypothetical protein
MRIQPTHRKSIMKNPYVTDSLLYASLCSVLSKNTCFLVIFNRADVAQSIIDYVAEEIKALAPDFPLNTGTIDKMMFDMLTSMSTSCAPNSNLEVKSKTNLFSQVIKTLKNLRGTLRIFDARLTSRETSSQQLIFETSNGFITAFVSIVTRVKNLISRSLAVNAGDFYEK